MALAVPPVRPPEDEGLQADLAAMRDVSSRLSLANSLGLRIAPVQHEQQRLERLCGPGHCAPKVPANGAW